MNVIKDLDGNVIGIESWEYLSWGLTKIEMTRPEELAKFALICRNRRLNQIKEVPNNA